jgi:hypothetical protein
MKRGNPDNLKARSPEEARALGKKGGIASGLARKEKKLLSTLYADSLARGFGLEASGLTLEQVVSAILARCDSSSVSMLKEIREATEGGKLAIGGNVTIVDDVPVKFVFVDPPARKPV